LGTRKGNGRDVERNGRVGRKNKDGYEERDG